MNVQRAVVFANGNCDQSEVALAQASDKDYIVCVDGGLRHCVQAGLHANVHIGDFDSVAASDLAVANSPALERIEHPQSKDASDLELALDLLAARSITDVVLLGISGGRTDHHLFNWHLCARKQWPFRLRLIDASTDAYLVRQDQPFSATQPKGQIFSVLPLTSSCTGVMVAGARFALNNATLQFGSTVGLSNVVTESHLHVSVLEGKVLVMLSTAADV